MLNIVTPIMAAIDAGSATITTDMLSPLTDGVVANVGVILPIGIGLFALFIGIGLIPGLIKKFVKS